jgi:ATP-dependent RNA helicase RhlE
VEIVVLDEADRMLDMGFIRDIRRILGLLPTKRQSLLFSATFSAEIRGLAESFLVDPAVVEVARRNAPSDLVTQVVHPVDAMRKRELLAHLIRSGDWKQVLVFTKTKHGANRLAQQLERDGITADAIHGNKSQSHRTRTLADFKRGDLRVMVATDIAARGLDIEELPHVVNYDLPHVPEDYVHRIGRTGRAGSEGEAVSLVCSAETGLLSAIERVLKRPIEQRVVSGFERGAPAPHRESETRAPVGRQSRRQSGRGDGPVPRQAADRGRRSTSARAGGAGKGGVPAPGGNRSSRNAAPAPAAPNGGNQNPQRKPHDTTRPSGGTSRPGKRGAVPALLGGGRYQTAEPR